MTSGLGTLAIDREGRFTHDGAPVIHEGVSRLLFENLVPAEGGGFRVRLGPLSIPVAIEDTPYVVVRVGDVTPIELVLQDGSRETLDPATLVVGERGALYCRVRGGAAEARFARGPHHAVGVRLRETADGGFELVLAGRAYRIGARNPDRLRSENGTD